MLISEASAQGLFGGAGGGGLIEAILPLVLIFAVFYFLLIRPQQKKMKMHKEMLSAVRRGDKVVTGGGIFGTVIKVMNDNEITVEIADGVRVRIARGTLSEVLSKTEPAQVEKKNKSGEGAKAN
jgi:preprotein translocase subunit YajC